ncbi:hypothetical protein FRB99_004385 [Tulasnella sp. 403]|nr:hypothetical protein FRB99_004385 [Tulasnella sp. 403]
MPRAANPPPTSSQLNNALRRNQACHQVKYRSFGTAAVADKSVRLISDALLPCGACSRSHAHALRTNPSTTPAEPECTYDNPEDVAEGPKGKIARLEARISELEEIVKKKDTELAACVCARPGASQNLSFSSPPASVVGTGSPSSAPADSFEALAQRVSVSPSTNLAPPPVVFPMRTKVAPPLVGPIVPLLDDPEYLINLMQYTGGITPGSGQLIDITWPLNIPPPDVLHHLVETFFNSAPLATRLLHRPTFMTSLKKPPTSRDFPHVALLHAICAISSLYTPIITEAQPDINHGIGASASFNSGIMNRADGNQEGKRYFPRKVEDILGEEELGFGPAHIRWCGAVFRMAMQNGDRLLQLMQAAIICAWYSHSRGKAVNTFSWVGIACRMALPLEYEGLSTSEGFEPLSRLPPKLLSLLPEPRNATESELARNAFWLVYTMERIYAAGTVWPLSFPSVVIRIAVYHSNDARMMPCRMSEFVNGVYVPTIGRQRLFTNKFLTNHPSHMTDSFSLYIKASVLLGRVKYFNIRFKLRYTDGQGAAAALDPNNPFPQFSIPRTNYTLDDEDGVTKIDPRETAEFQLLDNSIRTFIASIPREFKDPVGLESGGKLDPILYTAHLLPHVAMILLHDPHVDFTSSTCLSAERLLSSARSILDLIYRVAGTTYDLIYLDHACSFCWFVAGAAIIRALKVQLDKGDEQEVARMSQELAVVRFMLGNLGDRTLVGLRQIKLLDEIYNLEIGIFHGTNTKMLFTTHHAVNVDEGDGQVFNYPDE